LKPGAWGGIEAVADEIRKRGRRVITEIADVRSARRWRRSSRRALEEFGRIDILVNNAGAPGSLDRTLVVDLPEDSWDTVLDTNLKGTFITSQAVARSMLERGVRGRIISMSSQWGKKGGARRAAYCASKFGIIGFTQSLARSWRPPDHGQRDLSERRRDRAAGSHGPARRRKLRCHPARGAYQADGCRDAARAHRRRAMWPRSRPSWAGDAAEYITGQSINVTGGGVMH